MRVREWLPRIWPFLLVHKLGIVTLVAFAYFAWMAAPDITFINRQTDSIDSLSAARYLRLSRPTGLPLYNIVNHLLLQIPHPGTDYWWLSMFTALSGAGIVHIVYRASGKILSPLIVMASGIVVSQATVLNIYVPIAFLIVLAWWFHVKDRRALKYIVMAAGLAMHHLILIAVIALLIVDYRRLKRHEIPHLWQAVILPLGILPYIYIPVFNTPPYIWTTGPEFGEYLRYCCAQSGLAGGLAINPPDNLFDRFRDASWLIPGSFGVSVLMVGLGLWEWAKQRRWLWLVFALVPWVYWFTDLDWTTWVYAIPGIAMMAIAVAYVKTTWFTRILYVVSLLSVLTLVGFNLSHNAIGRNLDPNLSARDFYNQIDKLPNGARLWGPEPLMESSTIEFYRYEHPNRDIRTLNLLHEPDYQGALDARLRGLLYIYVLTSHEERRVRVERWDTTAENVVRSMVYARVRTPLTATNQLTGEKTVVKDTLAKPEAKIATLLKLYGETP